MSDSDFRVWADRAWRDMNNPYPIMANHTCPHCKLKRINTTKSAARHRNRCKKNPKNKDI